MDKKAKIFSIVLGVIVVFGIVLYSGSPELFQGRMFKTSKPLPAYDENRCNDSDGGKNYDEAGTVLGKISRSKSGSKSDFCNSDAELTEYYCNGKFIKNEKYVCENGCSGGACENAMMINNNYCTIKNFKVAFVLLYQDLSEVTDERMAIFKKLKDDLDVTFPKATWGFASINIEDEIFKMGTNDEMLTLNSSSGETEFFPKEITKQFFKKHNDDYHFIVIASANTEIFQANAAFMDVKVNIDGIGKLPIDYSSEYGSQGTLRGLIVLGKGIDNYNFPDYIEPHPSITLLHEIGHWVGVDFGNEFSGDHSNAVEIRGSGFPGNMHYYNGLESGFNGNTPLGANHWIINADGTYSKPISSIFDEFSKYHAFTLYAMGILPKDEYWKKYPIYDYCFFENSGCDQKAKLYDEVSVNDIIAVEGERKCK